MLLPGPGLRYLRCKNALWSRILMLVRQSSGYDMDWSLLYGSDFHSLINVFLHVW